jgi:hypothetical protein
MKVLLTYLRQYLQQQSYKSFFLAVLFVTALVTINYSFGIERRILALHPWYISLGVFFVFYGGVLAVAWGLQGGLPSAGHASVDAERAPVDRRWRWVLVLAPLYFACKMIHWDLLPLLPAGWSPIMDRYALIVLQLPAKLLLLLLLIYSCRKAGILGDGDAGGMSTKGRSESGPSEPAGTWATVGLTWRGFNARPYFYLLLLLLPLIALASTQPDFLRVYPKVKNIAFVNGYAHPLWPWKLLYELSYGLDFLSIELFFRGLLVIGLVRIVGTRAILPMAAFYCTIHFGKPLGECITSFFGGLILGVLAARTRSILGGLMVHLGLAWLMEVGGWLSSILLSNF